MHDSSVGLVFNGPNVTLAGLTLADFFRALLWGDVLIRVLLGVADVPSINEMERRAGEASRALLAAFGT